MWVACSIMVDELVMKDMKKVDFVALWEEAVGKKACSAWGRFGPIADLDFVYSFLMGRCGEDKDRPFSEVCSGQWT